MRRDAIIGVRIVDALRDTSSYRSFKGRGERKLTSQARAEYPPEHAYTVSTTPLGVLCTTYRGGKQEDLEQQLTGEYKHEVHRRIPPNSVQDTRNAWIPTRR